MTKLLLKIPHWVLFILVIGVPMIFSSVLFSSLFGAIENEDGLRLLKDIRTMIVIVPVIVILPQLVNLGWFYAVMDGLRDRIPSTTKIPVKSVKVFLVLTMIMTIIFGLYMWYFMDFVFEAALLDAAGVRPPDPPMEIVLGAIAIVPLALFSTFCIIYTYVYVGKIIKCTESGKDEKFNQYIGEFFLCWFWFIGVWILQPRVQRILASERKEVSDGFDQDEEILR